MNDKDHLVGKLTKLSTKDSKDEHKQSNRQVWDIFKRMSVKQKCIGMQKGKAF